MKKKCSVYEYLLNINKDLAEVPFPTFAFQVDDVIGVLGAKKKAQSKHDTKVVSTWLALLIDSCDEVNSVKPRIKADGCCDLFF